MPVALNNSYMPKKLWAEMYENTMDFFILMEPALSTARSPEIYKRISGKRAVDNAPCREAAVENI
jgi:hypothetical protein